MTVDLIEKIEAVARFESLVQFPEKRDPDWPIWSCRATKGGASFMGNGRTKDLALEDLLKNIQENRPAQGFGR